jgi:hypothetical protein
VALSRSYLQSLHAADDDLATYTWIDANPTGVTHRFTYFDESTLPLASLSVGQRFRFTTGCRCLRTVTKAVRYDRKHTSCKCEYRKTGKNRPRWSGGGRSVERIGHFEDAMGRIEEDQ